MYSLTNGYLRNKEKDITSSLVTVVRIVSKRNITGPEMPYARVGWDIRRKTKPKRQPGKRERVERSKPLPYAIAKNNVKQPSRKKAQLVSKQGTENKTTVYKTGNSSRKP
jgi:hypothetical protein